jgi:hypothetical protein
MRVRARFKPRSVPMIPWPPLIIERANRQVIFAAVAGPKRTR